MSLPDTPVRIIECTQSIVAALFPRLEVFHVLKYIPEQGEDVYHVLVSRFEIVEVDIPRDGTSPTLFAVHQVAQYKKRKLNKEVRRKLEAALAGFKLN